MVAKRHISILPYQVKVEICTKETYLILVIGIAEHLLCIITVQSQLGKCQSGKLLQIQITIGYPFITRCPHTTFSIRRTPRTIVKVFNLISRISIFGLIGSRTKNCPAIVSKVHIHGQIDICYQPSYITEVELHKILIIIIVLMIFHLI